jgi:hypothetical protein
MITLQDYVAMCDLDEVEVLAIAEHEHMPEIAAALTQYLLTREHGAETIKDVLRDDSRNAITPGRSSACSRATASPTSLRRCATLPNPSPTAWQ